MNVLLLLFTLSFANLGWTQSFSTADAIEDATIERQRLLRAADQMEIFTEKVSRMESDLEKLKQEVRALRVENQDLRQQLADAQSQRQKEKDALLSEVSKTVADIVRTAPQPVAKPSVQKEEGYEHVVEKGQSLWAIAQAYSKEGVKVSVDDIRRANNLKPNQSIHTGQKLFIPHR